MRGIKNAAFDASKALIITNVSLRKDYAGCVVSYKEFITQAQSNFDTKSLQIATLISGNGSSSCRGGSGSNGYGGGGGGSGYGGGGSGNRGNRKRCAFSVPYPESCEDRFFIRDESKELTPGNRIYLNEMRYGRVGLCTSRASKKQNPVDRSISVFFSAVTNF